MKRSRIRRVNPERRRSAFARCFLSDEFVAWTRQQPCAICGIAPSECHHARSRGAGGTWLDIVPLCQSDHAAVHNWGIRTFEAAFECNLIKLAEAHVARWLNEEDQWAA